ncbi:MAG TPA: ankyrin repeat domain-containing protein [Verrucomicrobiae bacterium]|nr:ankyrin repeat domain-containing protein [Verrucomicrobiae bacterium]
MSKSLPPRPSLEQLKKQAKEFLQSVRSGEPDAVRRLREFHPDFAKLADSESAPARLSLADAQLTVAREYGFASWVKLKARVGMLAASHDPAVALQAALLADDTAGVAGLLEKFPALKDRLNEPLPDYGFGATPLMAAVHRTNREMIDLLLAAGADINARSHWWAGSFGVLDNDHGLADFLIARGARVDAHAAARLGMLDKLRELVGADPAVVAARGGDGQTPLHFACSVEVAHFLLEQGADIDAVDVDHESTPAQYMMGERREVARYLVARGCRTDLLMAAALGDLGLVGRLLDEDPSRIHLSVSPEHFPKKNPRAGGSIYIWTLGPNKSPHVLAHESGHAEVLRCLMERSPDSLKLSLALELGDKALFDRLVAAAPDMPKSLAPAERRRLADAAQNRNLEMVRRMLEAGWPVDARGQHGGTALHWAAFHGQAEMTRLILRFHPPLEVVDSDFGGPPLGWAIHGSLGDGHTDNADFGGTVAALLKAGAKPPPKIFGSSVVQGVLREFRTAQSRED